jgi:LAO/AO transport system kinase
MKPVAGNLTALRAGGKAALARALSALEARPADAALAGLLDAAAETPQGVVIGLTGPPGVGKSTLTNALISRLRSRDQTVAVVAVDPSSRRSGGALLGDRTRIESDPEDRGVFVRSMAARQRLGGVADLTYPAAVLLRAVFDWVIVETVGVGQSETEIVECADLVVFCAQPGSGDALQFMKAGVMEVPDIVLVTKGDMGTVARRAAADLKGALSLADESRAPPCVKIVSSQSGEGLEAALDLIAQVAGSKMASGALAQQRAAQTRSWAESRIMQVVGQAGLSMVRPRLCMSTDTFAAVAILAVRMSDAMRKALDEVHL